MTEPVRGPAERALVQTSRDLSTWVTQPDLDMLSYSEGQGEIVGNATFRLAWGDVIRAGQTTPENISEVTGITGQIVRILQEKVGGSVTYAEAQWEPVWYGKMLSPDAETTGGGGITTYTAAGIASIFNERTCWLGRALVKSGVATPVIAFNLAPFNHWPSGDMSENPFTIDGHSVYYHNATKGDTGIQWSPADIIAYLMACNFRWESVPTPSGSSMVGFNWSIVDPSSCLDYDIGEYDAKGKTMAQVLNELAGKKRGLTWWIKVNGTTLEIHVASGLATAVTVGTETIPANPNIWDQLDGGNPFLHPFKITTIDDQVADEIIVQGSPRTIGITLAIYGTGDPFVADSACQLDKGWSPASETACNTWMDTINAPARSTAYEQAWRRFVIKQDWNGGQYGSGGMPNGLVPATDSSYGAGGYDGTTTRLGTPSQAASWYSAVGNLPCSPGFTALNVGPRQPLVILAEDQASGTWYDHTTDWSVSVEENPPAVVIDDGASGYLVRSILRAGRKILVSLSIRDYWPFVVSWRSDPSTWPTPIPRTKRLQFPQLSFEYLLNGMATGASNDSGGTLLTTTELTTKDNLVQMRRLLAQARAWYSEPYNIVTFTDRGIWDADPSYAPGTVLGNVMDGENTRVIEAMVTRRTVRLEYATGENGIQVPYWSTTWETDVVYPDLEAVL